MCSENDSNADARRREVRPLCNGLAPGAGLMLALVRDIGA